MTERADAEVLTREWARRGITLASLHEELDGTLSASDRKLSVDSQTFASVPEREPSLEAALEGEAVVLGSELGRGGMGVVFAATQPSLRREIAVKKLSPDAPPRRSRDLLKEAWVGANLEHPHVVPVHTLGFAGGELSVVMKRIEGRSWAELIAVPETLPESARADPLAFHLDILSAVADAIAFAHSRGILHLDLKPDNVMIGAFGQVYVLDWGLAAGFGDRAPEWLSPAAEIKSVAGTPAYMAPELAMGAGDRIGPTSDVFLLGACLHEALTGAPPHRADNLLGRLYLAYRSEPHTYGEAVPDGLVRILHRAMHRDPSARFPSVIALREALAASRRHRVADELIRDTRVALAALEAACSSTGGAPDELEVQRQFGSARFSLEEAREAWPEHPAAPGLHEALHRAMADFALDTRRPELARRYLAALETPDPEREARAEAITRAAAEERARLEGLERLAEAYDLSVGSRFRRGVAIALGLGFLLVNASMGYAERSLGVSLGYREMAITGALTLAALAPLGWSLRRGIFPNRANASLFSVCIAVFFVVELAWWSQYQLGVPFRTALSLTPFFYMLAFGALTVLIETRFFVSPLLQVPTLLGVILFPELTYEIIGLGGGLSAALVGLMWRGPRARGREVTS